VAVAVTAAIALTDAFELLEKIEGIAPITPLGWWLVMDWGYLIDRPWQWFHLSSAVLTLVIICWLSRIRQLRNYSIENDISPDKYYSLDKHPGRTIYWLQRINWICVVTAMFIGLWYFARYAHVDDKLPNYLDPFLATIFGPQNQIW